uniref:Insulin n=1 Tax=Gasterosteus aculeatus aculeatus TaxID=481459 RepID=A0AAQ4RN85_GASAC
MSAKGLVSLVVVLVTAVCVVHAQERIQMCGRELIRLAVSSCGNSRLRRSIPDLEPGQHQYTPRYLLPWINSCLNPRCLFTGYEYPSEEELQTTAVVQNPLQTAPEKDVFSLYPLSPRVRRAVGKISDICCEKGCSMKELIQFC